MKKVMSAVLSFLLIVALTVMVYFAYDFFTAEYINHTEESLREYWMNNTEDAYLIHTEEL